MSRAMLYSSDRRKGRAAGGASRTAAARNLARAGAGAVGRSLDPHTRGEMEARLGHDFSRVRIHTDEFAGASALALNAAAYTAGSDIVFAPGAYRPGEPGGRKLLAHELTHVVQQQGATGDEVRLDSSSSLAEREADNAAEAVSAGDPVLPIRARYSAPTIGRSLLGGIVGGTLGAAGGAVAGALLGSLLGPAGAVIGGIIGGIGGLIGGAIAGNALSTRSRPLSRDERIYAHEIYLESISYDDVRITRGSGASSGAARTTGNIINLQDHHFVGDTLDLSPRGLLTLIHELGHVWQFQNGGLDYIPSSLIPQAVAGGHGHSRNAAYNWRDAVNNRRPWETWNAEQQAELISDYNEALRRTKADNYPPESEQRLADINTISLAEPYIELVRQGIGAPGSSRRRRADPAAEPAAAGATP